MKFCTYQDSYAVLVCAKFCCDQPSFLSTIFFVVKFVFDQNLISRMGMYVVWGLYTTKQGL